MNKELLNKIIKVLLRQIYDNRLCPFCGETFIPQDRTQRDCKDLLNEIKELL